MAASKGSAPEWEVEIPDRRSASTWGPKPKATLVISKGSELEERLYVPVAVARLLARKKASDEVHPASRAELLYVLGDLSRSCARARIERLLDRREYSEQEVRKKLKEDGYTQRVIDECVGRACEVNLISDARYADSYIRSKVFAGWGADRIVRELSQRGIDVEEVPGWPYDYLDPEDELERAIEVARRRSVSGSRAFERLVRYLCSRGYRTGVAVQAAKSVMEHQSSELLVDF